MKNYRLLAPTISLAQSLQSRKTFWLGVQEMRRFSFPNQASDLYSSKIRKAISTFDAYEVDELLEWLKRSAVLGDLNDFDPYDNRNRKTSELCLGMRAEESEILLQYSFAKTSGRKTITENKSNVWRKIAVVVCQRRRQRTFINCSAPNSTHSMRCRSSNNTNWQRSLTK